MPSLIWRGLRPPPLFPPPSALDSFKITAMPAAICLSSFLLTFTVFCCSYFYLGLMFPPLFFVLLCDSNLAILLFLRSRLLPSAMIIGSRPKPTYVLLGRLLVLAVLIMFIYNGAPLLFIPFLAKCFFKSAAVSALTYGLRSAYYSFKGDILPVRPSDFLRSCRLEDGWCVMFIFVTLPL